jgi:iron complex transport system substrate-binding protein
MVAHAHAKESRLVTAGGSLTEIVYALEAQDQLVGVDTSSHFPSAARKLPDVGYYRSLNVEGVLSVKPEQLLLLDGAGPEPVVKQLQSLGLNTKIITNPKSVKGLVDTITEVATAIDREEAGNDLVERVKHDIAKVLDQPKLRGKTAVFLMSAGERGLLAAGKDTTPQLIFEQLGLNNPFSELTSFKPVSAEAIATFSPDIIFLASHTSRGTTTETLCKDPQLILWAEDKGCRLHKVDSLKFIGLTPRLPEALAETYELLSNYAD